MSAATINLHFAAALLRQGRDDLTLHLATCAVREALAAANRAKDARCKAACLRILHWLRMAGRA